MVGAHLSGQPLNRQLTQAGGDLLEATRTAADYRLFVLPDTTPAKPGLIRDPGFAGPGIEVEVWSLPAAAFGAFVAAIPAPLGVGKITLADGRAVTGFLCESHAVAGAAGNHKSCRLAELSHLQRLVADVVACFGGESSRYPI